MKDKLKQTINGSLIYFALSSGTEEGERKTLAYRAGNIILKVIDELCEGHAISKYMDPKNKVKYIDDQYELSKKALHNHDSGKLIQMMKKDAKESVKLATELDACYAEANDIMVKFLESEAVSDKPDEALDYEYFSKMMYYMGMGFFGSVDMVYTAWVSDFSKNKQIYSQVHPDAYNSIEEYDAKLSGKIFDKSALMMAGNKLMTDEKKVTKDELDSIIKECREQLEAADNQLEKQASQMTSIFQAKTVEDATRGMFG